jgi:hypothetical protein
MVMSTAQRNVNHTIYLSNANVADKICECCEKLSRTVLKGPARFVDGLACNNLMLCPHEQLCTNFMVLHRLLMKPLDPAESENCQHGKKIASTEIV